MESFKSDVFVNCQNWVIFKYTTKSPPPPTARRPPSSPATTTYCRRATTAATARAHISILEFCTNFNLPNYQMYKKTNVFILHQTKHHKSISNTLHFFYTEIVFKWTRYPQKAYVIMDYNNFKKIYLNDTLFLCIYMSNSWSFIFIFNTFL